MRNPYAEGDGGGRSQRDAGADVGAVGLTPGQVAAFRLRRHHLAERAPAEALVAVVRDVCGVQAQLGPAARMALWARVQGIHPEDVDRALWEERTLVKTWCMRGTVHLVAAADLPVYVAGLGRSWATAEMRWLARYGLTRDQVEEMIAAMMECLDRGPLSRRELAGCVNALLGPWAGEWIERGWGGAVKQASLRGLVCFGPDRGQEITFVRRDRWLPGNPEPGVGAGVGVGVEAGGGAGVAVGVGIGDAGPTVLRWYLRSYGPATWQDFAAWAGITVREAVSLAGGLGNEVVEVSVEGRRSYLLREDLAAVRAAGLHDQAVRLLPSFDPYLLGHHNKGHLVSNAHYKRVFRKAGWLSPVVLVDGRAAGVWSHQHSGRTLRVTVEPFGDLPPPVREQIVAEVEELGRFLDLRALTAFRS